MAEGLGLTVDDRAQLSRTLLAVLDANPPFSWVGFGGVDGTFVAAHRLNSGERRLNQSWITADRRTRLEEYALDRGPDGGIPVWHIAKKDSEWFSPSTSAFMINYRVDDLEELLAQLRSDGVETAQGPETHENGHFAWVLDPDGNKLELWQP